MAKQTFTTGQVLTAAQMTSLQQTAMLGGDANARTASYVLVAGDAGNAVSMNSSSPTTITVNNSIFAAGDIVTIINLGTGVCTITAGTATVATSGSLALAQNQGGVLRFTSASAAIFFQFATPASGDIEGVTAGTGISGGGTSGTVTITNSMATAIDAKGDLIVGTGADTFSRLAVGTNGDTLVADSATATGLKWVAPASGVTTWTLRNSVTEGTTLNNVAYNGTNLYVAVGNAGYLFTSPDGRTWTQRTSGFGSNNIQKVIFANNIWVAVGANGTITTSTDGTTWTARTSNMSTNIIYHIAFANGYFVAVGQGGGSTNTGGLTYSTDGITWTRRSMTPSVGTTYACSAYNGTNWIVVTSSSGSNNAIYASDPTQTWTAISTGAGNSVAYVVFDGTRTITGETNEGFYFSTSTTFASWTQYLLVQTPASGLPTMDRRIAFHDGRLHIANQFDIQSFSTANTNGLPNSVSTMQQNPTAYIQPNSTGSNYNFIWVGTAGIIIGGIYMVIFTSF